MAFIQTLAVRILTRSLNVTVRTRSTKIYYSGNKTSMHGMFEIISKWLKQWSYELCDTKIVIFGAKFSSTFEKHERSRNSQSVFE